MSLFSSHLLTRGQLEALKKAPRFPDEQFQLGDEATLLTYDDVGRRVLLPCYIAAIMHNVFGPFYMLAYKISDEIYAVIPHYAGCLLHPGVSEDEIAAANAEQEKEERSAPRLSVVATNDIPTGVNAGAPSAYLRVIEAVEPRPAD